MAPVPYPHVKAFVEEAMRALNVKNPRQLADALGMDDIDRESRVRRWVRGRSAPSFDYAMLLLSTAGFLTAEAERAWKSATLDPAAAARAAAEEAEAGASRATRAARRQRETETG